MERKSRATIEHDDDDYDDYHDNSGWEDEEYEVCRLSCLHVGICECPSCVVIVGAANFEPSLLLAVLLQFI